MSNPEYNMPCNGMYCRYCNWYEKEGGCSGRINMLCERIAWCPRGEAMRQQIGERFKAIKGEDMITIEDVKGVQELKQESNTVKYDITSLGLRQLFKICKELGLNVVPKKQRSYYLDILEEEGYVKGENLEIPKSTTYDPVKEPEHYKQGLFEVIDEMLIVFGPEKTATFCKLNAWKYRARAAYKGKFEEDMKKADQYLQMAYEIQQLRQDYPYYDGGTYEPSFLLKGDFVNRDKMYGGDSD